MRSSTWCGACAARQRPQRCLGLRSIGFLVARRRRWSCGGRERRARGVRRARSGGRRSSRSAVLVLLHGHRVLHGITLSWRRARRRGRRATATRQERKGASMPDIMSRSGARCSCCDGAMGTMLQRAGMPAGAVPRAAQRHRARDGRARSTASTRSRARLRDHEHLRRHAAPSSPSTGSTTRSSRAQPRGRAHRARARARRTSWPTWARPGSCSSRSGRATFDEVFDAFAEQAAALAAERPDAIFIETFTDIAEARCARARRAVGHATCRSSRASPSAARAHGPLGHRPGDRRGDPRGGRRDGGRHELRARARADAAARRADGARRRRCRSSCSPTRACRASRTA